MQSITLCDELECSDGERDEVALPGVEGPNLVSAALAAFRAATGWDGPPQRIEIPSGSRSRPAWGAARLTPPAALRLLARRSGLGDDAALHAVAAKLGSDVPSQLRPGRALVRGAGELVSALADPDPFGVLVLPSPAGGLSTAEVYREADRLGAASQRPRSSRRSIRRP